MFSSRIAKKDAPPTNVGSADIETRNGPFGVGVGLVALELHPPASSAASANPANPRSMATFYRSAETFPPLPGSSAR
jgi:hypothetical protein